MKLFIFIFVIGFGDVIKPWSGDCWAREGGRGFCD